MLLTIQDMDQFFGRLSSTVWIQGDYVDTRCGINNINPLLNRESLFNIISGLYKLKQEYII